MPRKGKSFEKLIEGLERALAADDTTRIESPKRLRDKTTGKLREHDVVITKTFSHHTLTTAIECRDHKRPVYSTQVEGFITKCQDTGINQGIIVSSNGFTSGAKEKAFRWGIRCLSVKEVDAFDWLLVPGMSIIGRVINHTSWLFFPETEGVVESSSFEVIDSSGRVVTREVLLENARQELDKRVPAPNVPVKDAEINVEFKGSGLLLRDMKTGTTVPLKFAIATIFYSVEEKIKPFRLIKYSDTEQGRNITDAAAVDINFGHVSGELMFTYKREEGGKVIFLPNKK